MDYLITADQIVHLRNLFQTAGATDPLGVLDSVERRPVQAAGFPELGEATVPHVSELPVAETITASETGAMPSEVLAEPAPEAQAQAEAMNALQASAGDAVNRASNAAGQVAALGDQNRANEAAAQSQIAQEAASQAAAAPSPEAAAAHVQVAQQAAAVAEDLVNQAQTVAQAQAMAPVASVSPEPAPPPPLEQVLPADEALAATAMPVSIGGKGYRIFDHELALLRQEMEARGLDVSVLDAILTRPIKQAA